MTQVNHLFPEPIDLDRRTSTRVGFDARVSACEYDPVLKSGTGDSHPVKASDLSQTGISFVTTVWPGSDRLLLSFGHENPSRAVARVVNVRCVDLDEEARRFEVSCQFQEWLPRTADGE